MKFKNLKEKYSSEYICGVNYSDPMKQQLAEFINDKIHDAFDNSYVEAISKIDNLPEYQDDDLIKDTTVLNNAINKLVKTYVDIYFKNIKNESSSKSFKDSNLYEYFPVGRHLIDLDMVAFQVWDELLPDKLGEENWIEFEYDDPRDLLGSNEQTLNFLAIGNKRELEGYFTTKNTKISVKFKHGSEAICNNVEEIVRFIIGAVNN